MENRSFSDISPPFNRIFEHYQSFNAVQSSLLNVLLHSIRSVVLSAPTGSGKTVAFELAIVRMLLDHQELSTPIIPVKAIYVAPIKALCTERFDDWSVRFESVGVQCLLITGDSELDELTRLRSAQVIITTPEKWDSLTRHWRDCRDVIKSIRLFLIDEVHLLNEDVRGPVLEAIVSRMHTIARAVMDKPLRFVVASATIPNVHDITRWIAGVGVNCTGNYNYNAKAIAENVTQLVYSDADRPVPLEKHVLGFNWSLRGFKFDMSLNYKLMNILRTYSDCKASLIFCNSRKSTEMAATVLEKSITTLFALSDQQKANLAQLAQHLHDTKLRKLTAHGIAYHHAGMSLNDRNQIEESFRQGNLMVLLCTNTLAMGVNLPARLVVIKSTEYYHLGKMTEYPESTLLQMIGRAGRPQYDTKGVAVILTHMRNVQKYETLMNGTMPVESHLHKHLAEHLNSEIALGTINNLEVAMHWMRSTYFYVRSMQNPTHYGLEGNLDKDFIEHKLEKMCFVQIQQLQNAGLISRNPTNELDVQTTSYGKLMAKYYLCFETMKIFRQIRGDESYLKIFDLIVRCREFNDFTLRVSEKRLLNALNDTPIRFPRAGRIKTREDKISCLLQAVLGNVTIASPTLAQESLKMIRIGDRIAKCLLEYMRLAEHQAHTSTSTFHLGRYKALLHTVTIAKCFHAKLWENSEYAAKQLQKIGGVYSAQLVCAGKTTLKSLEATDARTIEAILNKPYPFGDEILQNLQQAFPEYSLQLERESPSMVRVYVRQVNEAFICRGINAMIIVGDSTNQLLLFIEDLDTLLQEYGFFMKTIILSSTEVEKIHAHVIHATLVGVDVHKTLIINEPPEEETTTVQKPRQNRKRKQQTLLKTESKKKSTPNLTNTISTICDTTISSTVANKSNGFVNLQNFAFSKSKLRNHTISSKINDSCKELLNNTNNETFLNISDKQNLNNSTLIQTKLTHFFTQKKNVTPTKSLAMEIKDHDRQFDNLKKCTEKKEQDITLNSTLETTLMKFQKISKQRDIEFDKLKKSQEKAKHEQSNCTRQATTLDSPEISNQNDVEQSNSKENGDDTKTERQLVLSSPLRATTPDLHEISAFLHTQQSAQSRDGKQISNENELQEISTNRQSLDFVLPKDKQISTIFATQNSIRSQGTTQSFNIINSYDNLKNQSTSDCVIQSAEISTPQANKRQSMGKTNNTTKDTELSTVRDAKKSNCEILQKIETANLVNEKSAHVNTSIRTLNSKAMNCGISKTMQKELVESARRRSKSLSNEPLNLTRKTDIKSSEKLTDTASVLPKHPTQRLNIDSNYLKELTTKSPLLKNNEELCGLDLTRKPLTYRDESTRDDVSAMSISLTSKSSETLKNSSKSIENYILSYKCALVFSRLTQEERTIVNFKKIYKRLWQTSSAIDYITHKLSNSSISQGGQKKRVTERRLIRKRDPRRTVSINNNKSAEKEPLNQSKGPMEQQKIKDTSSKLASKIAHTSKGSNHKKSPNVHTKADESATTSLRNPYRLQLLNASKNELKTAHNINNDVMHLVLDMKCKAVSTEAETHLVAGVGVGDEENLENAEMHSLPSMSFEEYCSYMLQSTNNKE